MLKFKTVFSLMGALLVLLLVFKITMEIRDNFEDKEQDPYLLKMVEQLSQIPRVKEIVYRSGLKYVFICMYDKDGKLYPKNQLTLVLLHEIAHAICDEIGHTQKFQTILDELLEEAKKRKLYDPSIAPIVGYCSHNSA
jgi:hypothetical protein